MGLVIGFRGKGKTGVRIGKIDCEDVFRQEIRVLPMGEDGGISLFSGFFLCVNWEGKGKGTGSISGLC
jgi:hypothetical protein